MSIYFFIMLLILVKIGFWETGLLKETIIWFIAVGLVSSISAVGTAKDIKYFINSIKKSITILIIFQFVVNLYSFPLIWEIIQVLIITIISMIVVIMDVKPEYQDKNCITTRKFLNAILAIMGFYILYHSIKMIISNFDDIVISELIKAMLLPLILTIMFIFYVYSLVIYAAYEQVFVSLSFKKTIDNKYRFYLKLRILMFCNINLNRINNFIHHSKVMNSYVRSKDDVKKLIENCKKHRLNEHLST